MIWLWSALALTLGVGAGVAFAHRQRHPAVKPAPSPPAAAPPTIPPDGDTVLAAPPMVDGQTLRWWFIHNHPRPTGQDSAWMEVVHEFYTEAAKDPDIKRYFIGVDMEALCKHFLAALLVLTHTGLTERAATTLGDKHQYLAIRPADFDKVTQVLVRVLQDNEVPYAAIEQLVPAVTVLRERIVQVLP